MRRLSIEDKNEIKEMFVNGESKLTIQRKFKCAASTISYYTSKHPTKIRVKRTIFTEGYKKHELTLNKRLLCGRAIFLCNCGKEFVDYISKFSKNLIKNCGCTSLKKNETEHQKHLRLEKIKSEIELLESHKKGIVINRRNKPIQFGYLLSLIRSTYNAKGERRKIQITPEDIKNQWEKQNGICPYSKVKLEVKTYAKNKINPIYQASIDRIDSSKSYVPNNIQIVSVPCNYAKNNMSDKQMKDFINTIINNYKNIDIQETLTF